MEKFIEKVKNAARNTYETAKSKIVEWKNNIQKKYNKWKERLSNYLIKQGYKIGVSICNPQYTPNPVDENLRQKCQKLIDEDFPMGLVNRLEPMSDEDRYEFMKDTVMKASGVMQVYVSEIKFFYPSNELEMGLFGVYDRETDIVYLNAYYISELDQPERTEHLLKTIFHELKHARQAAAIFDNKNYGYSNELLLEWALNFKYYIDAIDNYEAYKKQPIEVDAANWANLLDTHAVSL